MSKRYLPLIAAAAMLAAVTAASAQRGNQSAEQNVRESEQYERLLCTNPAFRARRIAQECGPLQGSNLYESCQASFQCKEAGRRGSQYRQAPPSERMQ